MAETDDQASQSPVQVRVRRIHRRDLNRAWEFLKYVFRTVNQETVEYQRPRTKHRFFDVYDDDDQLPETAGAEDPETVDQAQDDNVVVGGDPSAAAASKSEQKNTVKSLKEKKVPNEKRTTTPYMTKYEKARVLGTRALQIRWV